MSMNGPKFSKSDRTMKAFSFVERKNMVGMYKIKRIVGNKNNCVIIHG